MEYLTPRGPVGAVDGVSFAIAPGEVFGLAGESGCGKSTIAHSILRVLRPPAVITGGEIRFQGRDVLDMDGDHLEAFRWKDVSMVFQSALNSLNPVMRVKDQIADVIVRHEKISKQAAYDRAAELLRTVGIERSRLDSYPHELSGGMRQRVVIAIALALRSPMMIMDEPTTVLDVVVQKDILQQIEQLKQQMGFSILFITHDLSLMVEFSDRIGDAASIAFLGTKTPSPELLDAVSPALRVTQNTPSMFLWATAADELVPAENTDRMATALAHARVPFEVHVFEQGAHGLSLADQSTADALLHVDADAQKWVGLVETWLKKRFALPLPLKPAWLEALEASATKK